MAIFESVTPDSKDSEAVRVDVWIDYSRNIQIDMKDRDSDVICGGLNLSQSEAFLLFSKLKKCLGELSSGGAA